MESSGHAVRMDALHLIRSAAEFADALERDAQTASTTQLSRAEEEIRTRQQEMAARTVEVERFLKHPRSRGAVKLLVVSRALRLRRDRPDAFRDYAPVRATGPAADSVVEKSVGTSPIDSRPLPTM